MLAESDLRLETGCREREVRFGEHGSFSSFPLLEAVLRLCGVN
jgi:hypothetical protein